jgi:hypothetical protein
MPTRMFDRWSWGAVDTRITSPDLNLEKFARDVGATVAAARRFVQVRRTVLDGRSTLNDLGLCQLTRYRVGPRDVIVYLRVAERITYSLACGTDVTELPRMNCQLPPAPPVRRAEGPLHCSEDGCC